MCYRPSLIDSCIICTLRPWLLFCRQISIMASQACLRRMTLAGQPLRSFSLKRCSTTRPSRTTQLTISRTRGISSSVRPILASSISSPHRQTVLREPYDLHWAQRRHYADKVVKVPEMAESITEGTLKQWAKQIGDFVERDEEIATIETDKVMSTGFFSETNGSDDIMALIDRCLRQRS